MNKEEPKERNDYVSTLEKCKTLADIAIKPGEFYSVLTILDGHLIRYVVVIHKDGYIRSPATKEPIEPKDCFDPILVSAFDAKYHLAPYEFMLCNLHNAGSAGKYISQLGNLTKFRKQYIKEGQCMFIKNPVSFVEAGFFLYRVMSTNIVRRNLPVAYIGFLTAFGMTSNINTKPNLHYISSLYNSPNISLPVLRILSLALACLLFSLSFVHIGLFFSGFLVMMQC